MQTSELNRENHQYSARVARPRNVAYFLRQRTTDSLKPSLCGFGVMLCALFMFDFVEPVRIFMLRMADGFGVVSVLPGCLLTNDAFALGLRQR